MDTSKTHEVVQEYYANLQSNKDLKTQACCTSENQRLPKKIRSLLGQISDEVASKYYGCGSTIPPCLEGATTLDLGSGSGRDCFLMSALVGSSGRVFGVDMTPEQLEVANRNIDYHRKQFGYLNSNVSFHLGYLESLDQISALEPNSFDVITSNCVINLVKDKELVLKQIYRLLKPGGEFYFSDVYADRRVPMDLQRDPLLWGECISGALYIKDFISIAKKVGFADPRLVSSAKMSLGNAKIEALVAPIQFYSSTYRLFKIDELDISGCEDYGQAVKYRGTIDEMPRGFALDNGHVFLTGKVTPVCRNTTLMLSKSRFARHFEFFGDERVHFGPFASCSTGVSMSEIANQEGGLPTSASSSSEGGACCGTSAQDTCCALMDSTPMQLPEMDQCCPFDGGCGACGDAPSKPASEPAPAAKSCCGDNKKCC